MKGIVGLGLAIGIAVLAPALAPALLSALGTTTATALATSLATALIATALSVAAGVIMQQLAGKPASAKATPINFRNSVSNSFIIIGKRRQGGKLVFYHPVGKTERYFIWAAAGHRCKGVTKWFLNDEEVTVDGSGKVTSGVYANHAWLWFGRGSYDTDETPAGWRAATGGKWTIDHVGYGVAKIYAKFEMTKDVVSAGMPTMSAEIEGSDEIRDPRTGTVGYTNLATPAFYWWLAMPREEGGFGAAADEIPGDALLSAWTNICDENVDNGSGGTEKRYAFDSLIEVGAPPSQVRDTFVTCCAGGFTFSEGVFLMRPGYWVPPSMTLDERDLAGGIRVSPMLDAEAVATDVSGTFVDPEDLYQPGPIPTRRVAAADIRQVDYDLAHVTSHTRAQRILEIMLRRAQCEKRVDWPMNIAGLETRAMQTVQLGTARYGLSNYTWAIDGWSLSQDYGVALGLREENADIYAEPVLLPKQSSATPDAAEAVPLEADSAALLGGTYGKTDIDDIRARLDALEP
ncbi:hypothetical protein KFK14_17715 [Sphingobium phenoxybenzoativorans]|uniref:Tip attachment protein J domain-containing protein n=1 Tax=Sphingobium phenoxybenzoativorans TaxID=1592790 RepID=A0A975K5R7_9SPHN|nr:phage tail protein [Sphingobium phenoxybenzoativorans]QUT04849.1 hypothetical protein KFK14_17715 [Sphingobium phenoxybenzoativorans]